MKVRWGLRSVAVSMLLTTTWAMELRAADDLLIADFEGATYGRWQVTGNAFGDGPARGALPGQMSVDGFVGERLVNSFSGGDDSIGTLTSPEFTLERPWIAFRMGGGKQLEKLALQLIVNGQVVRSATGSNEAAGGSETLVADSWDVRDLVGQRATIRIVDDAQGGWGHLNVDHLVQTDQRPPGMQADVERQWLVQQNYLNVPIQNGAPRRVVSLVINGQTIVKNDIELAVDRIDWWAPLDVSLWRDKNVTLRVDRFPDNAIGLTAIEASDTIHDADQLYREPTRGQFHFSPRRGWNNDPNGLVYFQGEYHLFFQHNPYGWNWGNMHWGHAISRDLVHWQERTDVLLPDSMGPMFSGSAVVDVNNTSGLGRPGQPAQVLFYTAAGNPTVQCLAFSLDGRNFTKYGKNPILPQISSGNRDPKVIWHAPTQRWVMTLYVEVNGTHTIQFFTSTNLKDWKFVSQVEGFYECPDFFELPVDGNANAKKWVLTAASSEYTVGTFDGERFHPETSKLPGHQGRGFYAAQTYSDIPASDGRRLQIGWFQTPTPGMPFNQSMTLPLELKLHQTTDGPRLTWHPARETQSLRAASHVLAPQEIGPNSANPLRDLRAELVEIVCDFQPSSDSVVQLDVRGANIRYDAAKQELSVNDHRAKAPLIDGHQRVTVFCDRMGLEIFASDGLTYVPFPYVPAADQVALNLQAIQGTAKVTQLEVYELRSIWNGGDSKER